MKFSDDILKKIIGMGSNGYSFARISHELNMTPDQLQDERMNNEKLNDALIRAEFNADQYRIGKIEENSINLLSRSQIEVYKRLIQKHSKDSDNEIIIKRV